MAIQTNLYALGGFVESLAAALALFDHSAAMRKSVPKDNPGRGLIAKWPHIAARDGAMSIYHFGKMWQVMPTLVRQTPTLWELVDREKFNSVGGAFETGFPQWALVRKGVAHMGDFMKAPNRISEHVISGPRELPGIKMEAEAKNLYMTGALFDRTFMATVEGKPVQYDLSAETVTKLNGILLTLYAAFQPAERALMNRRRPPDAESPSQPETD